MPKRKTGRPKNAVPTAPITIMLPLPDRNEVRALAAIEGLTGASWVRRLVVQALTAIRRAA